MTHYVIEQRKIRVAVQADLEKDRNWEKRIRARLTTTFGEDVDLSEKGDADWILWVVRHDPECTDVFTIPNSVDKGRPYLWITDQEGKPLVNGPLLALDREGKSEILVQFDRDMLACLKRESLFRLDDGIEEADFDFTPLYYREGNKENGTDCFTYKAKNKTYCPWSRRGDEPLPTGTVLAYRLKNKAQEKRYLYVVNFGPDGQVVPIFPNRFLYEDEAIFQSDEEKVIKLKGSAIFNRPGWEHIRVISTVRPLNSYVMQVRATAERGEEKGFVDPLSKFLLGERGQHRGETSSDNWRTQLFTYEVHDGPKQ